MRTTEREAMSSWMARTQPLRQPCFRKEACETQGGRTHACVVPTSFSAPLFHSIWQCDSCHSNCVVSSSLETSHLVPSELHAITHYRSFLCVLLFSHHAICDHFFYFTWYTHMWVDILVTWVHHCKVECLNGPAVTLELSFHCARIEQPWTVHSIVRFFKKEMSDEALVDSVDITVMATSLQSSTASTFLSQRRCVLG